MTADNKYGSIDIDSNSTNNSSNSTGSVAVCPPGCSACSYYEGAIHCTTPMSGYALDSNGDIIKCDDSCATCASLDYTVCTSCYGASILSGSSCVGCQDQYALTCPKNNKYSTTCVIGYSAINGVCRQCASNCLSCGVAGYLKCDDGGCSSGYVKIVSTSNCTRCLSSCSTCSTYNPSVCLSCGTSSYLSNSSTCIQCNSACLSCSSSTVCTTCPTNSVLDSSWCYTKIGFPCATQSKSICIACYVGFSLVQGTCVVDNTCNGTSTCTTCDKNYYLQNKKCFPCQT